MRDQEEEVADKNLKDSFFINEIKKKTQRIKKR